jgi:hypothetical protein
LSAKSAGTKWSSRQHSSKVTQMLLNDPGKRKTFAFVRQKQCAAKKCTGYFYFIIYLFFNKVGVLDYSL